MLKVQALSDASDISPEAFIRHLKGHIFKVYSLKQEDAIEVPLRDLGDCLLWFLRSQMETPVVIDRLVFTSKESKETWKISRLPPYNTPIEFQQLIDALMYKTFWFLPTKNPV